MHALLSFMIKHAHIKSHTRYMECSFGAGSGA
jgi:hypothetical protein